MLRLILILAVLVAVACRSEEEGEQPITLGETVGANTHYASGGAVDHEALSRLAEAGVSFIRNDLDWASVEKEAGIYDFAGSGFDELVDTAETLGLRILFILDYGNPLYGETRAVVHEDGRRAFAAFAAAALRAADPDGAIVVGALYFGFAEAIEGLGLGIGGPRFLESVAATGALALADEVTLHLYRPGSPEDVITDIELARDLLDQTGYPLPVSSGEWGYSTYDPDAPPVGFNFLPAVTPDRQASYLARMLLFNYTLGLPRSVIFKDRDASDPEPGDIEHQPDARVIGRDGSDLTPQDLAHGAQVTLQPDDGPIYLLGDVSVTSISERSR
jgi:hypothetical protein